MPESLYALLPYVAVAFFVVGALVMNARTERASPAGWQIATFLAIAFAGWTAHASLSGGPFGFWTEHSRNAWSNQIWFDLLLGIGVAWVLLLPRARAVGMSPLRWLLLILLTGGIGLLIMLARCLFLENQTAQARGV